MEENEKHQKQNFDLKSFNKVLRWWFWREIVEFSILAWNCRILKNEERKSYNISFRSTAPPTRLSVILARAPDLKKKIKFIDYQKNLNESQKSWAKRSHFGSSLLRMRNTPRKALRRVWRKFYKSLKERKRVPRAIFVCKSRSLFQMQVLLFVAFANSSLVHLR